MASYDFIVVGTGPAGATIASRLSRTKAAPSVLLLEAGGSNDDSTVRLLSHRWRSWMIPSLNWGYETVPQAVMNGKPMDYSRGKGLGGSSAINYACYSVGPKEDYDEWACLVGDHFFDWDHCVERRRRFETYTYTRNPEHDKYVAPVEAAHGASGPVKVEIAPKWEKDMAITLDALDANGWKINKDLNSGNPIGTTIVPNAASKGWRSTAAVEFLQDPPQNLTILTDSQVTKVTFEGKRATGVEVNGKIYSAKKEVILCAGSLNTPQILMLSGVGPEEEITKHGIRMVHSLPGIGRNLQEHVFNRSVLQIHDGLNDLPKFAEPTAHDAAQTEFIEKGTGQYDTAYHAMSFTLIKISEELLDSAEFKALPPDAQAHIKKRGVPVTEVITHSELPSPPFDPTKTYLPVAMVPMATQSRGTVTLASADPYAAPVCDPKVLTHPFDLLNYKLSMRQLMRVLTSEPFAKFTTGKPLFPASESDEDIMAHCAQTLLVAWHMSCTAKMGKRDDEMACVDTSFRVHGLEGLRVADMSVIPFVFNTHLVAVAYTVGETAAERFIEEYGLED